MKRLMNKILEMRLIVAVCFSYSIMISAHAAETSIVNLMTTESGMHRISYQALLNQGVDLGGLKHTNFSLSSNGQPVPISTKGQDNGPGGRSRFGPGGYIEFYATQTESLYTDRTAYTLHYGGQRLAIKMEKNKFKKNSPATNQYVETQVIEENRYYDFLSPSKTDPWHYGQIFAFSSGDTAGTKATFTLDEAATDRADFDVQVYGLLDLPAVVNDHHFVVKVNGVEVGDQQFDGNISSTLSLADVPVSAESNTLQIFLRSLAETPFDAVGLNRITVRYRRNAIASDGYLEGYFEAEQAIVEGVDADNTWVFRKEVDGAITQIVKNENLGTAIGFNTDGQAGTYIVVSEGRFKVPFASPIRDEIDISHGRAEYLIITHGDFIGAELEELRQLREADYSVKVVDVAQIYGQFGRHVPDSDAIDDYIRFAAQNLGTRFVTLVGSDTFDYKQYKTQSVSYVPTRYVETPGGLLIIQQTPSDAAYGDLDDDGIPDIPVGRLSARNKAELGYVVEKLRDYSARVDYAGNVLISADKEDFGNGVSFADDVRDLIDAMPPDWADQARGDYLAIPDLDGDQVAHDKIVNGINNGVLVTAYIGHSSQQQWSRATPALFKASEVASLTNVDKPTLVTQWGCWNTYFVDPGGNTMADKFLVSGLNGAATVLGASTLTTSRGERLLGIELNKRMYGQGVTIGEAVVEAKQALALIDSDASDILLGWQILGDPALVVNP